MPQQAYLDAIKCHSDVVRPVAADQQVALSINPYHLGFAMWEKIVENEGLEAARNIMIQDDDFAFVRNHLTRELAEELSLFRYSARSDGQIKVLEQDLPALHEAHPRPEVQFRRAHRCRRSTSATTARWSCCTTTRSMAAGSTSSAAAKCWITCSGCGDGRCSSRPSIRRDWRWS